MADAYHFVGVHAIVEGNILVPIVMRNAIGLSPFLVAISLLAGFTAGGPLGGIVAVPAVAAIEAVLERLQAREIPVAIDVPTDAPGEPNRDQVAGRAPGTPTRRSRHRPKPRLSRRSRE